MEGGGAAGRGGQETSGLLDPTPFGSCYLQSPGEGYNYKSAARIVLWGGAGFKTFPHQPGTVFLKSLAGPDGTAEQ